MFIWILYILPLILAITIHEAAHGYAAKYYGDDSAYLAGRLSLNPIKHIDILGTLIIPIATFLLSGFVFGWAKPVPIDFNALRAKSHIFFTILAGPGSNLMQAFLWLVIYKLFLGSSFAYAEAIGFMASFGVMINLLLAFLNLLPILPLDGGRIVALYLPYCLQSAFAKTEKFGLFIVLALLFLGVLNYLVFYPTQFLTSWLLY